MLWQVIFLIIFAYLLGSVPTAYIAGRALRGIDIRSYGSGSVSGSNVWQSVSRWATVPVGIADISKGVIPVVIAWAMGLTLMEEPKLAQGIVGLAAIAGHNWSIFLRFTGGRGIATMMGVLVVLAPWELLVFIGLFLLGIALFNVPVGAFIAAVALPLASLGFGEPLPLTLCLLTMTLILIAKRLMANRGALIVDWRRVLVYRLLLDRDIPDREAWVHRTPSDMEPRENK